MLTNTLTACLLAGLVFFSCQSSQPPAATPQTSAVHWNRQERVTEALGRAVRWMAAFPEGELRYDAALGLTHISRRFDHPSLDQALAAARRVADRDTDNPMQRFFNPGYRVSQSSAQGWTPPQGSNKRANTNRPVVEALYCDQYPIREQVVAYITGPMRDNGGYHTTHGLWALVVARDNGCLGKARFQQLSAPLRRELKAAQPKKLVPNKTLEIDLYAEQALMLLLAGEAPKTLDWVETLLDLQALDGSWGIKGTAKSEPPYHRFHATMISSWALAVWLDGQR